MSKKLFVEECDVAGKRVLVRVDFNVPLDTNGTITNDNRIVASLPTIQYLVSKGAKVILMSHLGRPKGKPTPEFSLKPVADELQRRLDTAVSFARDCVGEEVKEKAYALQAGEILLLENLRFHDEEKNNDPAFAEQLAQLGEVYVNDAFGTAHRAHASTEGVTHYMAQCAAGYLLKKEIEYLGKAIETPRRPFVAILGGAKISGKIDVIRNLLDKVDALLIGGGMAYTFFKAMGKEIGRSLLEADKVDLARSLLDEARQKNATMLLPQDCVITDEIAENASTRVVDCDHIPADKEGADIGPKTVERFAEEVKTAQTVVWNGPMGVFEVDAFAHGTNEIARVLADATRNGATTIIGGGDSASAIAKAGLSDKMSHISTGGGASLEYLEGKELPGIAALTDAA